MVALDALSTCQQKHVNKVGTVGFYMMNHNQDRNNFQEHAPKKYFLRHL